MAEEGKGDTPAEKDVEESTLDKLDEVKADFNNKIVSPESSLTSRYSATHKTGFDCEFIEKPKEVQSDCPICLMVLREPHQATCCGHVYCRVCIQRVVASGKDCPTCKEKDFKIFFDKSHHKHLYSFKVWCCNQSQGCNWAGELGQLAHHLNDEYMKEQRLEGCDYTLIICIHCSENYPRMALEKHERSECFQRPFTCQMCKKYEDSYIAVTKQHQPQCIIEVIPCPNDCGEECERGSLEVHLSQKCSKLVQMVPCEFSFAGCMEKMVPEKVEEHHATSMSNHLSLLGSAYSSTRERFIQLQALLDDNNEYVDKLASENKTLKLKLDETTKILSDLQLEVEKLKMLRQQDREAIEMLQSNSSVLPVTILLNEYDKRKSKGDMGWTSPPFYTHQRGYFMCLWVDVGGNGQGKGIYISVFLSLLKGDYDNNLSWPFKGSIAIKLLNQSDKTHHTEVIKYHDSTPKASAGRIMEEGKKAKPWGKGKFIRHEEIRDGGFLLNDAIKFYITKA